MMKKLTTGYFFTIILLLITNLAFSQLSTTIRLNQIGFYTNANKIAVVAGGSPTGSFSVKSTDGVTTYYTGTLGTATTWAQSGESVRIADFTAFTTAGNYRLDVAGVGYSYNFKIDNAPFLNLQKAMLRCYYYNRSSTALPAQYAGIYARNAGHPDNSVIILPSAAGTNRPAGTVVSCPKGWYDAGDYNSYIVNSGISTYTLLAAYEHYPTFFDTLNLNIPESGDAMPDILDEIKWNLDWMLTMQDPNDGGVYNKKTNANFDGWIMPDAATTTRYLCAKGTAAALDFAAVMAVAYRVYLPFDATYAKQCSTAAKNAYTWAVANPNVAFNNPGASGGYPAINTGGYGDTQFSDELEWAKTELYISTKNDTYYGYSNGTYNIPSWNSVRTLGLFSMVFHRKNLTALGYADTTNAKNKLLALATTLSNYCNSTSPYKIPMGQGGAGDFGWGSNSQAGNQAMILMNAYRMNKDVNFLNAALAQQDYILGRNGTGYSFVTGFGSMLVTKPHHRQSEADGITAPIPGWVVGGPTQSNSDGCATTAYPATSFVDGLNCYTKVEVTINWNCPMVYVHAAVDNFLGDYSSSNQVTVSLTAPANNSKVAEGSAISLSANATTVSGTITKVEFYADNVLINSDATAPYSFTWNSATHGNHSLKAIAYNSNSLQSTSSIVNITVVKSINQTATAPTIDGTIDAVWSGTNSASLPVVLLPTISSSTDLSANFKAMWDNTNLYFLIDVTDDAKVNDSPNAYDDDNVELYIDIGNTKATTYGANDFAYSFGYNDATVTESKHNATIGVVLAQTSRTGGYVMEVKIPWSTLTLASPAQGVYLGFEVMVNDDDDGTARDGKISWTATQDNAWQDPSLFGTAVLSGQLCTGSATITPGGATTFCTGGNVALNANTGTGYTYVWKNGGTVISGITTASYQATASGSYTVDITQGSCTYTSSAVTVTVNTLPTASITAGGSTTICSGNSVTLNATTGTGYTYQWMQGGTNLNGSTNNSLVVTNAGSYSVQVTANGCNATSNSISVTVNTTPVANITPAGPTTFCTGGSVILNASTGTGYTYQWFNSGNSIAGATNLQYSATTGGSYTVQVTANGCVKTSAATTVTMNSIPNAVITPAGSTTICSGNTVTLNASIGTGYSYVWMLNGTAIASATNSSYQAGAAGNYTVQVTANGCQATSTNTTVTVNALPTASITPTGTTAICSGSSTTLTASSGVGYSYQWLKGGAVITNATSSTYVVNTAGAYSVQVTANGCQATSATSSITVTALPIATITPSGSTTICQGSSVSLTASTGTGYTYVWFKSGTAIANATNSTYNANTAGSYTVQVTANNCQATSAATTVSVTPLPTATITPSGSTSICAGNSVTLNASTGAGYSYQWLKNSTAISNATSSTYIVNAAGSYTVQVTANSCQATSSATSVTVNANPTATITAAGNTTFCTGGSVTLNANTGAGLSYQWKNGGTNIPSATASSYAANQSGSYTVDVTSNGCVTTSAAQTVTVNAIPTASIAAGGPTTFCTGGSVALNATTGSGFTYKWYNNNTVIAGATSQVLTATQAGSYTVEVTSNNCSATSSATNVTINQVPGNAGSINGAAAICQGSAGNYSIAAVSGATSYQWTVPQGSSVSTGNNTNTIEVMFGQTSGSITVVPVNSCGNGNSATISVNVAIPQTANAGPDQNITSNSANLSANAVSPGTGNWSVSSVSGAGVFADSHSNTTLVSGLFTGDNIFVWTVDDNICPAVTDEVIIRVGNKPQTQTINGPSSVVENQQGVSYSVSSAPGGSIYHWSLPAGAVITSASADSSSIIVDFGTTGGDVVLTETNVFGSTESKITIVVSIGTLTQHGTVLQISVYPNPFLDEVYLNTNANSSKATITVIDSEGKLVKEGVYDNLQKITLGSDLSPGVYYLKVVLDNEVRNFKLVKIQ